MRTRRMARWLSHPCAFAIAKTWGSSSAQLSSSSRVIVLGSLPPSNSVPSSHSLNHAVLSLLPSVSFAGGPLPKFCSSLRSSFRATSVPSSPCSMLRIGQSIFAKDWPFSSLLLASPFSLAECAREASSSSFRAASYLRSTAASRDTPARSAIAAYAFLKPPWAGSVKGPGTKSLMRPVFSVFPSKHTIIQERLSMDPRSSALRHTDAAA
mmetsp:Transcript_14220/g.31521  ORF Transcript_14220/g.31521 Transcript_14220/m.31521 type:complete len:210 (+) Transcript_14220:861-1490(+)